jgi:C-terminal processing protease CtpA/Prc
MSHLTAGKLPVGYTVSRRLAESGYQKEKLRTLDRLPTHLPNILGVASMAAKYVGRDPSITLVTEGLGTTRWHGHIAILVNEHTVSAGEMVAAFASENHLATIVGTETAGRLIPGSGFKVGQGYMLIMPKAQYITWQGHRFEGAGIKPDLEVPWSPDSFAAGIDNQLDAAVKFLRKS